MLFREKMGWSFLEFFGVFWSRFGLRKKMLQGVGEKSVDSGIELIAAVGGQVVGG